MQRNEDERGEHLHIRRGRVDSVSLYEVTDYELDILEKGSPHPTYLNFSIFILSIAGSFVIALSTTNTSMRVFTLFVAIAVVGALVGTFLLILWWQTRDSVFDVVKGIRGRISEGSGVTESASNDQTTMV